MIKLLLLSYIICISTLQLNNFNNITLYNNNNSFTNREIMKILNYKTSSIKYSEIIIGGLDKFINISIKDNGNLDINEYKINYNKSKIDCLILYTNCNYYIRIVIRNDNKPNHYFICMSNRFKSKCFDYDIIENQIIGNQTYISDLCPQDPYNEDYIYLYSKQYQIVYSFFQSLSYRFIYNSYTNNISLITKEKLFEKDTIFLYSFELTNYSYFLYNEMKYIYNYFTYTGNIVYVNNNETNNNKSGNIFNTNLLNCSMKYFHEKYNKLYEIQNFPILTSALYMHSRKILYVTFIESYYKISSSSAICIFHFDKHDKINPNGEIVLIKSNSKIISIVEINDFIYILYNKNIVEQYKIDNNKLIKDGNKVILPYNVSKLYVISDDMQNIKLFVKKKNKLIFFNINNNFSLSSSSSSSSLLSSIKMNNYKVLYSFYAFILIFMLLYIILLKTY